jgi:NAD(P)-dependent dehydrogenase (short-subunit alcohol dehydrogenase family)
MGQLGDRIALVTGGSRGIGLAIARALDHEGAALILVGRDSKALREARRTLSGPAEVCRGDVRRPNDVRRIFEQARRRHRRLDILVNNAGMFTYKPFIKTSLTEWENNLQTNLTSLFLAIQAALPLMARSRSPHIVNVLSISARSAFPNCSAYTASKFGALGLTRVGRQELRPLGIRVTAVLPGVTNTAMLSAFGDKNARAKALDPEDVAKVVVGAILQPPRASVEEISILPSSGVF